MLSKPRSSAAVTTVVKSSGSGWFIPTDTAKRTFTNARLWGETTGQPVAVNGARVATESLPRSHSRRAGFSCEVDREIVEARFSDRVLK